MCEGWLILASKSKRKTQQNHIKCLFSVSFSAFPLSSVYKLVQQRVCFTLIVKVLLEHGPMWFSDLEMKVDWVIDSVSAGQRGNKVCVCGCVFGGGEGHGEEQQSWALDKTPFGFLAGSNKNNHKLHATLALWVCQSASCCRKSFPACREVMSSRESPVMHTVH